MERHSSTFPNRLGSILSLVFALTAFGFLFWTIGFQRRFLETKSSFVYLAISLVASFAASIIQLWNVRKTSSFQYLGQLAVRFIKPQVDQIRGELTFQRIEPEVLLEVTYRLLGIDDSDAKHDVRVTLFKVDGGYNQPRLSQVARFSRTAQQPGSTSMSVFQGVAGRSYVTEQIVAVTRVDDFSHSMIDLGFAEDEASRFRNDRKTIVCYPVLNPKGDENRVTGVLWIVAKTPELFTPEQILRVESVLPLFSAYLHTGSS